MGGISEHISYAEATRSAAGERLKLVNTPNEKQLANMRETAAKIFEPLRAHFGKPITVLSMFRSPAVNKAVGGASTSQHMTGEAMDIRAAAGYDFTTADIFYYIRNHMDFDQLIWEFGNDNEPDWVHVSWNRYRRRKSVLKAVKQNGKTIYKKA
ncbi:MAG: D-Ala-D-Ala carboxypeptidase family metallohydrolase [Agriterribacter sp.]